MRFELRDGVELALELFFRKQRMDLRVTRPANADDLPHDRPLELSLVTLVVVARARDQVMTRQRFPATADRAFSLHRLR